MSASFVSVQIVMGLGFLQATQIYRRRSVMQQDDITSRQDDRTNRQDNKTSRQGNIENRHQVFF